MLLVFVYIFCSCVVIYYTSCNLNEIDLFFFPQLPVIRSSWSILKHEIDEVGVYSFLQLFDNHPTAKDHFKSFRDVPTEELQNSEIFRSHASRVTNVIKKVKNYATCQVRTGQVSA